MPEPNQRLGLLLLLLGAAIAAIGGLVWLGALAWFGRLPGDLRIHRGDTTIFIPLTSMLLASAVLSLVMWLVRRWL